MRVEAPCIIIGDIHGQFFDLSKLMDDKSELFWNYQNNFLFLGDYVDRGIYSVEVLVILFTIKIKWPKRVILLRGNHECRAMTQMFTFRRECLEKYDKEVYERVMEAFDTMPLCSILTD